MTARIRIESLTHETPEGDRVAVSVGVEPGIAPEGARVVLALELSISPDRAFEALGSLSHAIATARRRPIECDGAIVYLGPEDDELANEDDE